jgi:Ca-activated chloride channel family protein
MPTSQQAYVLLEIGPEGEGGSGNSPVNFCLVLDRSGSMAGEKLQQMKEAAKLVVERMSPRDVLSVIIFDDSRQADLVIPAGPVEDPIRLKQKLDQIEERGGTHMSTGLELGLRELERGKRADRVSGMILLTDGQTWEDEQACRDLADRCRSLGFPIYVMGLGVDEESNWDPRLLEEIAQRSGGEWKVIESPEEAVEIFEKTLVEVKGALATNARLTLRFVPGVAPRAVWRVSPLISRLDQQIIAAHDIQIFLGDIVKGSGQTILVDLALPPRPVGEYRLAQADVCYDQPGAGTNDQKAAIDLVVRFTENLVEAEQTEAHVMNIVERVVAHRLQTQALDEAAHGDMVKATQRLRAAATRLLELGENDLARRAEEQAGLIEQQGNLDPAEAKKMRYATRRLVNLE